VILNIRSPISLGLLLLILVACIDGAQVPATAVPPTAQTATLAMSTPTAVLPTATAVSPTTTATTNSSPHLDFDGDSAFVFLEAQTEMGPRWAGSPGHTEVRDYISDTLAEMGWSVEQETFNYQGFASMNIIGRANEGKGDIIILGTHYDTRRVADQTPGAAEAQIPVLGAVDGASGVAVLLELARTLDLDEVPREIWLAFFDVEDNGSGGMPGWDWIAGSKYMAANLNVQPEAAVVVDMVGDADQQMYYETNSHQALRENLWQIAADLGYGEAFVPEVKYNMIGDHLPFAWEGIPAVFIIDFDYPYWHTVEDTVDKASPLSLLRVGQTLEVWLEEQLDSE
jgi:Zn-dependent M28 family amino/carboxypeptidase